MIRKGFAEKVTLELVTRNVKGNPGGKSIQEKETFTGSEVKRRNGKGSTVEWRKGHQGQQCKKQNQRGGRSYKTYR